VITNHQRHRRTDGRTDGQTDRRTTCDPKTAHMHLSALRGKNVIPLLELVGSFNTHLPAVLWNANNDSLLRKMILRKHDHSLQCCCSIFSAQRFSSDTDIFRRFATFSTSNETSSQIGSDNHLSSSRLRC